MATEWMCENIINEYIVKYTSVLPDWEKKPYSDKRQVRMVRVHISRPHIFRLKTDTFMNMNSNKTYAYLERAIKNHHRDESTTYIKM